MGEAEPTELAPSENATESVYAWGLADYDEAPTTRFTAGRITGAAVAVSVAVIAAAGLLAWQHLRQDTPTPVMVTATMTTTNAPVAITPTRGWLPSPTWHPPTTVTAPSGQIPPDMMAALDRRFIQALLEKGWTLPNPDITVARAHQVCVEFQQHATMADIKARLAVEAQANGAPDPYGAADEFAYTALEVYPNCERA
jgi:hypothetical protein